MSMPATSGSPGGAGRSRRHYAWTGTAALLVVIGVISSVVAAGAVGRHETASFEESFKGASENVASTFGLAIQHEDDLIVGAGGLLADPDMSQTGVSRWAAAARVLDRYPELSALIAIALVEDADLAAFTTRIIADPVGPLAADGTFAVDPPGTRPFYCLNLAIVMRGPLVQQPAGPNSAGPDSAGTPSVGPEPAGSDFCADSSDETIRTALFAARDSGLSNYRPVSFSGQSSLVIQTPIYRGGDTPTTVKARREALVGWVGTSLDPTSLLAQAASEYPGLSVELRYQEGSTDLAFSSGTAPAGASSETIDLQNGWTVQTFGVVDVGGTTKGSALVLLLAGVTVSGLLGLLMFVLGTGRESARRQLEQRTGQLNHQALHDALTGLPNRVLVMDRAEQMLIRDRRHHTVGALLFLDLDDFKNVNDTLGHGAGDRLLIAVTDRLASTLRGVDTIGRMGGDEFVVLIDGDSLDIAPELVAQRLLDVMAQPFELDDASMPLTVNISIGIATGDRASAGDLLRDADIALYQAKAAGKNRYATFDPEMQTQMSRRTDLESDLRSALTNQEYRLVYQPIYELEDLTVVGVEALLRWDHPTRGLISPDEFIPILEQTGRIGEVGRWALHEACQQMAIWHSRGDTLDISVNISARQLEHDAITDDIRTALHDSGLPASALIIEVTETALMHNIDATARRLQAVKKLGVRIAVDDFGTGYSSLAYLQRFPLDCIKIDRAFTGAVTTSPESRALIGTLVQLGKDLGLATLAEGVETTEEIDILRGADVNQAQGFLMAHPLEPEALEAQLLEPIRPTSRSGRP